MALPVSIKTLIQGHQVESSRIEYKASWNPESCIHTICAFANDIDNQDGGYIIIGVEEQNGRPVIPVKGIDPEAADRIEKEVFQYCHFIEPFYLPRIEVCEYEGKTLIVLWAAAGNSRPFSASRNVYKNQREKVCYVRRGSCTIAAEGDLLRDLYENSGRLPFDDRINPFSDITDLDADLMREHLKDVESSLYELSEGMPASEIAENMNLLDGPSEARHPRNVGILMFSRKTQKYFPCARIEVVNMPEPTGINMAERTFTGTIQNQLYDALEYIKNSVLCEKIEKPENSMLTKRTWNYPYRAVKELLANAVYHRDYRIYEPITVTVTPNYIEIRSFPGFDRSITTEMIQNLDIRSGGCYRNRRIGNFLKELQLTEGRNTGIPMSLRALEENGSDRPLFITDAERQSLTVRIPVHREFADIAHGWTVRENRTKYRTESELKADIISALSSKSGSARDISRRLGYSGVSASFNNAMQALINAGTVTVSGTGRATEYALLHHRIQEID